MSSSLNKPFSINGVLSTDKTVLQNLNELCSAASTFLTYDVTAGKWAVVINRAGTSVASFNDTNILGNINISDVGVSELYNAVSVEFPHVDLRDEADYVDLEIPSGSLFANETKNVLNMQINCINNPVQAQYLGSIELKQSRVAKIIEFRTDYSKLGLKAGDLISVTSAMYSFTNKVFRIVKLEEDDTDGLIISITAREYDADVYSTAGLTRVERTKKTGIILASQNEEIRNSEAVNTGDLMTRLLVANAGAFLLRSLFSRIFQNGQPTSIFGPSNKQAESVDKILSNAKNPDLETISGPSEICEGSEVTITVTHSCSSCLFNIPPLDYQYIIAGVSAEDVDIPLTGFVTVTGGTGSLVFNVIDDAVAEGLESIQVTIGNLSKEIDVYEPKNFTYSIVVTDDTLTEGQSTLVTLNTTGLSNGTVIPYTITGTGAGKVTSPPLTGTVTINSNNASFTLSTSETAGFDGNKSVTVTFDPGLIDPCDTVGPNTAVISIADSTPAPNPEVSNNCATVEVPIYWCAGYDSAGRVVSVTPLATAEFQVARPGGPSVNLPTQLTVTSGLPSTINIAQTVAVDTTSGKGGREYKILTSFNTVAANQPITGTATTVMGL